MSFSRFFFNKTVHFIQENDACSPDHPESVSHVPGTREIQEEQESGGHHSEQLQKLQREATLVTQTARRETQQETRGTLHAKSLQQVIRERAGAVRKWGLSARLSVFKYISFCVFAVVVGVSVGQCLSVSVGQCLSACLGWSVSVCLSVTVSLCQSVCLGWSVSVCLSRSVGVCLSLWRTMRLTATEVSAIILPRKTMATGTFTHSS